MKSILIPSLVAALLSPAIAFAASGVINFTGSVVGSTCVYTGDGNKRQTVKLPRVNAAALSSAGTTAGDTAFDVRLSGCGPVAKNVAIYLSGGAANSASGNLNNTTVQGGAGNVSLQLANRNDNSTIRLPNGSSTVNSTADGNAVIPLLARYIASGQATAGTVTSSVNFSITYP